MKYSYVFKSRVIAIFHVDLVQLTSLTFRNIVFSLISKPKQVAKHTRYKGKNIMMKDYL